MIKVIKKDDEARVTFTFHSNGEDVKSVDLVGDWNGWGCEAMKKGKDGSFTIKKVLKVGNTHEFGYKINSEWWRHDETLPTVTSPFGSYDSVLSL